MEMGIPNEVGQPNRKILDLESAADGKHSVPCGAAVLACLALVIPKDFPALKIIERQQIKNKSARSALRKLDLVGFLILLIASVFLVAALEEAGTQLRWSSAFVVAFLVLSSQAWLWVVGWAWIVDQRETSVEPVFTWRFLRNRVFMGALLYVKSHGSMAKVLD